MSNTFRLITLGIIVAFGAAMVLASTPENPAGSTDQLVSAGNAAIIGLGVMILLAGGKTANALMQGGR